MAKPRLRKPRLLCFRDAIATAPPSQAIGPPASRLELARVCAGGSEVHVGAQEIERLQPPVLAAALAAAEQLHAARELEVTPRRPAERGRDRLGRREEARGEALQPDVREQRGVEGIARRDVLVVEMLDESVQTRAQRKRVV